MRNYQAIEGVDDLFTVRPELEIEWDFELNTDLNPRKLKPHSNKAAWWRCSKNHVWRIPVTDRTYGSGCPYCSGRFAIDGVNDLATVNPKLAAEWDCEKNGSLTPQNVKCQSNKKVWWLCKKGHSWQAMINSRTRGCGCPYCSGLLVLPGYNDIATLYPDVAAEWDYIKNGELLPSSVAKGTHKKVWWLGKCGHSWATSVYHRCRNDRLATGCPYCAGKKVLTGFNDLANLNLAIATEWDYEKNGMATPSTVSSGSHKKYWWRGKCGHNWEAAIFDRSNGSGCPYCRNLKVLIGFNDLMHLAPHIALEWDYENNGSLKPTCVTASSEKFAWWICSKGHRWRSKVSTRSMGARCPKCNGQQKLKLRIVQ